MSNIVIQEKKDECNRLIQNISENLPGILARQTKLVSPKVKDFLVLMKFIRDNFKQVQACMTSKLLFGDIDSCIKIRNALFHQDALSIKFLDKSINVLEKCQNAFNIQSAIVPLRVMACKYCNTTITRTAQPVVKFKNLEDNEEHITRTYDVQSWVVAGGVGDFASRTNNWYPGWVWTYTYCGKCSKNNKITRLGFRFDWAPGDRVDLTTCKVSYLLARQAMIITFSDGSIRDLTHVVSDGKIRRHFYGLFENELIEIQD